MKRYEIVCLFLLVLAGLCVRLRFFSGTLGNDDLRHAYAAYFLFEPGEVKRAEIDWPEDTHYRRMGVNLPLWASMRAFGVHEWSLALAPLTASLGGIVVIYVLARGVADAYAGLAAAGVWAFLPGDVYQATLWLQDNILSTLFALFLLCLVMAGRAEGGRRWVWSIGAGLVLGYMQYTKETAPLLLGPVILWSLHASSRQRRWDWTAVGVVAGFGVLHVLMGVLFYVDYGEALRYWERTHFLITHKVTHPRPFGEVIQRIVDRLYRLWLLGYGLTATPLLLPFLYFARRARSVLPLLVLATCVQFAVVYVVTRTRVGQDRDVLQLAVPFILLTVLGAHGLLTLLPAAFCRVVRAVAYVALIASTAAALDRDRQQYGRDRTESIRKA